MSRRRLLTLAGIGAALATGAACARILAGPVATLKAPPASRPPVSVRVGSNVRLHMFQTGWVAVKAEHKAFSGPAGMRIPAIMASITWTEWMPVTAFAIEHPEGLFVVDTGETARMLEPDYAACDQMTGMFYRRNLQFALNAEDEIGPQMRRHGLDPARVTSVIMTHLHSDHMGGMGHFPNAPILVSERASRGHTGALMCRIPTGLDIRGITMSDRQLGVFPQSFALTQDGTLSVIPTPGHAAGHQSVILETDGISLCIAGDASFSLDQITSGEIGGIVDNVPDARASSNLLKVQYEAFGTIMLPTHDPENASRLMART